MMLQGLVPPARSDGMRVELNKKALFALASDTRLEILRALQPMRRTVSQIAGSLDLDKAAVHRHLQKLVEGDLVRRHEDHGFVYYGLSWKARDLLAPNENTKIVVLLSSFFWAVMGSVALGVVSLSWRLGAGRLAETAGPGTNPPNTLSGWTETMGERGLDFLPGIQVSGGDPMWWVLAGVLGAVAAVLLAIWWRAFRGPRQALPPGEAPETPPAPSP